MREYSRNQSAVNISTGGTEFQIMKQRDLKDILAQIAGVENIDGLTDITLRMTSDDYPLYQLSLYLPSLYKLVLDRSNISSLRELGNGFQHLVKLYIRNCYLTSLDGLFALQNLKVLDASCNYIKCLTYLGALKYLKNLNLSKNRVCDLKSVVFLKQCESLRILCMSQNPCTHNPEYRSVIITNLPQIEILDGMPINESMPTNENLPLYPTLPEDHLNSGDAGPDISFTTGTIICGNLATSLGRKGKHELQHDNTIEADFDSIDPIEEEVETTNTAERIIQASMRWKVAFDSYKQGKF